MSSGPSTRRLHRQPAFATIEGPSSGPTAGGRPRLLIDGLARAGTLKRMASHPTLFGKRPPKIEGAFNRRARIVLLEGDCHDLAMGPGCRDALAALVELLHQLRENIVIVLPEKVGCQQVKPANLAAVE